MRPRLWQVRREIRDLVAEYRDGGGEMTVEAATPVIRDRVRELYGESPWLELILKILEELLPLLIELLKR